MLPRPGKAARNAAIQGEWREPSGRRGHRRRRPRAGGGVVDHGAGVGHGGGCEAVRLGHGGPLVGLRELTSGLAVRGGLSVLLADSLLQRVGDRARRAATRAR